LHSFFAPETQTAPIKVLVVDIDPRQVQELALALRGAGYLTVEATSFVEGKRRWMAERPQVLVADVALGEFNGLQLLMRVRDEQPDTLAVLTCPYPDSVLEAEATRLGSVFLVKPVGTRLLLAAIRNLIDSRPAGRPEESEARVGVRNGPWMAPSQPERRGDRRKLVIPGFAPERRLAERRASA
jgi:DNA-binding response OmpR family regulator